MYTLDLARAHISQLRREADASRRGKLAAHEQGKNRRP